MSMVASNFLLAFSVAVADNSGITGNDNDNSDDGSASIFVTLSRGITTGALLLVLVYYLLKLYPALLHKRKQLGSVRSKTSVIGHRGSTREGLVENTKAAFKVSEIATPIMYYLSSYLYAIQCHF